MAIKHPSNKYLTLEDVRISYRPKDDSIHITSGDPDVQANGFHLTLNKGTQTEESLRELLTEQNLITAPHLSPDPVTGLVKHHNLGKIITVSSSKGGSGKTSTAIALTTALHQQGMKVVLVDADFRDPCVIYSIISNNSTESNRSNLSHYIENSDENKSILDYMTKTSTGWEALLPDGRKANSVTVEVLDEILSELINNYDVVIVDTGVNIEDSLNQHILHRANYVLWLATNTFRGLFGLKEWFHHNADEPFTKEVKAKSNIIVNFVTPDFPVPEPGFFDIPFIGSLPYSREFYAANERTCDVEELLKQQTGFTRAFRAITKNLVDAL